MHTGTRSVGWAVGTLLLATQVQAASTLTFCHPVETFTTIVSGFFVLDVCPTPDPAPEPDGDASTPLGDPAQCWTFVHPTDPYTELAPMVFRIPAAPVPGPVTPEESAGAQGQTIVPAQP